MATEIHRSGLVASAVAAGLTGVALALPDGCDPLVPTGATGELYVFTQAGAATQSQTVPVDSTTLKEGGSIATASAGSPGAPTNASGSAAVTVSSGESLVITAGGHGSCAAQGGFAFAREDVSAIFNLPIAQPRRVRVSWSLQSEGVASLMYRLSRDGATGAAAKVIEEQVSSYSAPQTSEGSVTVMLPAGSYRAFAYGTAQSNSAFLNPDPVSYGGTLSIECARLGDVQGDGVVDGADLGALLGAWGPVTGAYAAADLNQDGFVDGADLGLLLGDW